MSRIVCLVSLMFLCISTGAQVEKYGAPTGFPDLQTIYIYQKSNWDGSHASQICLYVADSNRLQSFKWAEGDEVATLVSARIDWKNYSVSQFQNHRIAKGKEPQLVASLFSDGATKINIEVGSMRDSLALAGLPWQSYDFDFAGLGFTWRALKDKMSPFFFHIADAGIVNGDMRFVNKGRVQVQYKEEVMLDGKKCLRYTIDGEGLENRGGQVWINAATYMIEQYMIELPDEPGFENGMLKLLRTEKMSKEEWERFKKRAVGN